MYESRQKTRFPGGVGAEGGGGVVNFDADLGKEGRGGVGVGGRIIRMYRM